MSSVPAEFASRTPDEVQRFMDKVDTSGDCWPWTAATDRQGYSRFNIRRGKRNVMVYAHRYSYEHFVGPIPDGLQIDHLCRVRACVNPSHLEAVTGRINVLRGGTITARNAAKTHCPQGHEYTPENTYTSRGWRECRPCSIARAAQSQARKKESARV